jgi:hypothetical protein
VVALYWLLSYVNLVKSTEGEYSYIGKWPIFGLRIMKSEERALAIRRKILSGMFFLSCTEWYSIYIYIIYLYIYTYI